ncbi:hypothetical protein NKJ87_28805 [Mesorhizobium sp. M0027]|uniref:hypothetical protein n=1 Tax=Mesorhizobium sp. M0027 TaxID=2956848 RepID=UPI003336E7EA
MRRTFAIGVVPGTQCSELCVVISSLLVDPGEVLDRPIPAVAAGNRDVEYFFALAMQHGQTTPNGPKSTQWLACP